MAIVPKDTEKHRYSLLCDDITYTKPRNKVYNYCCLANRKKHKKQSSY